MDLLELDDYHVPRTCEKCGGVMVFKGVGEYQCEDCKSVAYDDYGKVRLYIENHRGATAAQVEEGTGVTQKSIRKMLRESRLEVTADSVAFLHCEICGKNIRYGRMCPECEARFHKNVEEQTRQKKNLSGYAAELKHAESGMKRFERKE